MGIGLALVWAVVTVTFVLLHLAPGDPARLWVSPGAGADELDAARRALGLDRPLLIQYVGWIADFARGDWGTSLAQNRPVTRVLLDALPHTLLLSAASLMLTYVGGIIVGLIQAVKHRSRIDTAITTVSLVAYGMPAFWLALILVLVFTYTAARNGWPQWLQFPAMGVAGLNADFLSPWQRLVDRLRHLVLPLTTLSLIGAAGTARYVRGALLDVRSLDYVRTARAKGLTPVAVELRHVLRNGLLPVVTLLGLALPALFSGTVFVEVIFAWPGIGREMVGAVGARDYPVVMASTAVFASLVVLGNLLADLLYTAVDPRLRRPAT